MLRRCTLTLFIFFSCIAAHSQVCTGSLGDPVINVTFGNGPNPGTRLPNAITNYNYIGSDCPNDGNYTIINSTNRCFLDTWFTVGEDHTPGDVNGYMMLVNASFVPGDFYLDTVKGLCPNTTYEFAAWIMNVLKITSCSGNGGIRPNLTFNIETTSGNVLSTFNTGAIDPTFGAAWKQYGVFFTTPANVNNVVLRLTNNAVGGCGNDLILDDITFRPCGPSIQASFKLTAASAIDVCADRPARYDMSGSVSNGYTNPAYQWQMSIDSGNFIDIPGAVTLSYTANPVKPGMYRYRLAVAQSGNISSAACRIASNLLTVQINPNPAVKASVNNPVCEDGALKLTASALGAYSWTGPNGFSDTAASPVFNAKVSSSGKYYVRVTSAKGCTNTDSVSVQVFPRAIADAGADQTICEGETAALNASQAAKYVWSPATGLSSLTIRNPLASPRDTTRYTLTITDVNGCSRSDSLTIFVYKKPVADAGPEIRLYEGQSGVLEGSAKGSNIRYYWSPASFMSGNATLKPTVRPTDNSTYTLFVVSNVGCGTAQDNVFVRVFKKVVVPNAFSPNGDGINDEWNIEHLQTYTQVVISVFNRYGQDVFHSNGYNKKWNGTLNGSPVPAGTYYYTIDLKNGNPVLSGWVLIVR